MFKTMTLGMCAALWMCAPSLYADNYRFVFDGLDDGVVNEPLVGIGSLSFDGPQPGDGTYAYDSFTNVEMTFDFSAATVFTEAHIVTPTDEVTFVLSNGGQTLNIGNTNNSGSGPFTGSLDFVREDGMSFLLSTEPPSTMMNLDRYFVGTMIDNMPADIIHFGNYGASLVPEPTGIAMLVVGFGFACFSATRRKSRATMKSVSDA